jgi:hypothetical protein
MDEGIGVFVAIRRRSLLASRASLSRAAEAFLRQMAADGRTPMSIHSYQRQLASFARSDEPEILSRRETMLCSRRWYGRESACRMSFICEGAMWILESGDSSCGEPKAAAVRYGTCPLP